MKRFLKSALFAGILFVSMLITSGVCAQIPGWSILNQNGPQYEYEIDYETKRGDPVLHVKFTGEKYPDRYVRFNTSVKVEAGKTYIYGLSIKSEKSQTGSAVLRVDWDDSASALPKGSTFDWTEMGKTFTAKESKNSLLGILIEKPAELWIDDFFCYEYVDGKKTGPNLVLNSGFNEDRVYDVISYKDNIALKLMAGDEPMQIGRFIENGTLNYYIYAESGVKKNLRSVVYCDGEPAAQENIIAQPGGKEYAFSVNGLKQGDHEILINVLDENGGVLLEYSFRGLYTHAKEEFLERFTRRMGMSGSFSSSTLVNEIGKFMRFGSGRYEYGWAGAEKEKGVYNINTSNMDLAYENGFDVIPLICYNNELYADGSKYGIHNKENLDAYADYCLEIQKRFPYSKYFEIWNEPNGANWWYPAKNPTGYSYMAEVAGMELKRKDKDAKTLIGVVAEGDAAFVNNTFNAGLYPSMDVVANHPYIRPSKVDAAYDRVISNMTAVITRHGGWKEQMITEVGWPTTTNGTTWEQAAVELAKQGIVADYYDIQQNQYYMYGDVVGNADYTPDYGEYNFGVITSKRDGKNVYKPSTYSIKTMMDNTNGAVFCGKLYFNGDPDIVAYAYARDGEIICAVWSRGEEKTLVFDNELTGVDMNGNPLEPGKEFLIKEEPVYLKGLDKNLIVQSLAENSRGYLDLYLNQITTVFDQSRDKKGFDRAVEILYKDAQRAEELALSGSFPSEEEARRLFNEHYEASYEIIDMYKNSELEITPAQLSALLYLNHWSGMIWNAIYILAVYENDGFNVDMSAYENAKNALVQKAGEKTLSYSSAILGFAENYKNKAQGVAGLEEENPMKAGVVKGWNEMCNALSELAMKMIEAEPVANDNIIVQLPDDETGVDLSMNDTLYASLYNFRDTLPLSGRVEIVSPKGDVVGSSEELTLPAGENAKVAVDIMLLQIDSGAYKIRFMENEEEIVSRTVPLTGNALYKISLKPVDTVFEGITKITLNIENLKEHTAAGKVSVEPLCGWELEQGEKSVSLDAFQSGEISWEVTGKKSVPYHFYPFLIKVKDSSGNIVYEKIQMLNFSVIKQAEQEIDPQSFDGNISGWEDAYPVYVQIPDDPTEEENWVGGNYSRMLTKWDENYLYMLFDIYDFNHANVQVASSSWNGDAIQIGIDTLNDGGAPYNENDYEYCISNSEIEGDVVYAFAAPKEVGGGRKPDEWMKFVRDENRLLSRYILRIPKDSIKPLVLSENNIFAMDILVNDANLTTRDKYAGLANGIADGKKPELFWEFKLVTDSLEIESEEYPPIPTDFNSDFSRPVSEAGFSDISGHWAEKDINYMAGRGFVSGKSADIFEPDSLITRAEFVTMLVNIAGLEPVFGAVFKDVDESGWYSGYVNAAFENGLIPEDVAKVRFFPQQNITREEAAAILNAYYSKTHAGTDYKPMFGFSDCTLISPWAAEAFQNLFNYGVINGNGDGTLNPKGSLTRAETVVMLRNALE